MTVRLAAACYGDGPPLAILHGLFGSGRNWASIAQRLAAHHRVIALDLRNHGASPWAGRMQYAEMAGDVVATLRALGHTRFALLGHSMGGKAAMAAALVDGAAVERLVVVDIAPVAYPRHHLAHVRAMRRLDLAGIGRRGDADARLAPDVPDAAERGLLLQNLVFEDPHPDPSPLVGEGRVGLRGKARWRLNLEAIERDMPALAGFPSLPDDAVYGGSALFVAGGRSDYLRPEHKPEIRKRFPYSRIECIAEAGHWVHAEQPRAFLELVEPFLAA